MSTPSVPAMPRRPLGQTGLEISVLGFGASPLGGVFQAVDPEDGAKAVEAAFRRGINFFDTSPYYGDTRSETVLGLGLARLSRDQIVVATKVGRYGSGIFDFSAERVIASIQESLERLQLTYVDLIQCHDIEFVHLDQIINETLPALAELKKNGLVRHVGITGLPLKVFRYILDRAPPGSVDVALSYCHHTLCDRSLEQDILPYLQEKKVGIINASPLCMGLLTPQGPPEWHPAPPEMQAAARQAAAAAAALGVSLPKLAIMDSVQNEDISTNLVGICTEQQVHDNCDAVLQALGLLPNENAAAEAEALVGVKAALEPVMGMTWESGLPENN